MTGVPGVSDFPTALDTHSTLLEVRELASTTLTTTVNASVTTFIVPSTALFPNTGAFTIEGEAVIYTSKDATHFLGCTRGRFTALGASAAAGHTSGVVIKQLVIAATHEVQNDGIIATQTKVGSGASTPTSAKYLRGNGAGTSAWSDIASGDVVTALGYTPVEGVVLQESDVTKVANATTIDVDGAYLTISESPAKEGNLTFVSGALQDAGTLTIASGAITLSAIKANVGIVRVTIDTESAAATDDLDTISVTGAVAAGTILILTTLSSSRDVTVKSGTGNLTLTDGDFVMGTTGYRLMLVRTGSSWVELARQPLSTTYQVLDAELTALAGLTSAADRLPYFSGSGAASLATFTAAGRALVDDADAAAQRMTLGLVIGTNVQAQDAELAAIAGLTSAANKVPYFTGSGAAALADLSAAGRALIDDADAVAQRATLGVQPGSWDAIGATSWTNMPAALSTFGAPAASFVVSAIDLSHATELRLITYVRITAGVGGSRLRITDGSLNDLANIAGAADCPISTLGINIGSWAAINPTYRTTNQFVALCGIGGDSATDPSFGNIRVEYR